MCKHSLALPTIQSRHCFWLLEPPSLQTHQNILSVNKNSSDCQIFIYTYVYGLNTIVYYDKKCMKLPSYSQNYQMFTNQYTYFLKCDGAFSVFHYYAQLL